MIGKTGVNIRFRRAPDAAQAKTAPLRTPSLQSAMDAED